MRVVLACLVALLACGSAAGAAPAGFRESGPLTVRAATISGVPDAGAFCARTRGSWENFAIERGGYAGSHGLALRDVPETYLAPYICSTLEKWLRGKPVTKPALALAVRVLIHEAIHLRGVRNECVTDRRALKEMPRWLRQLFGVKNVKTQAALMKLARAESLC